MLHPIPQHGISREVHRSLATYLANRNGRQMVTMTDAIHHLRSAFPDLSASDYRLTDVIAGRAIILGLNIEFDRGRCKTASVDRWSTGCS